VYDPQSGYLRALETILASERGCDFFCMKSTAAAAVNLEPHALTANVCCLNLGCILDGLA
jgi:hypothetical protein